MTFFLSKITSRIDHPGIIVFSEGSDAHRPTAHFNETTAFAFPLEQTQAVFQSCHNRVGSIHPDFRKWPLSDVAECLVHPELVGVNKPLSINAGNANPGGIKAAPVPNQFLVSKV